MGMPVGIAAHKSASFSRDDHPRIRIFVAVDWRIAIDAIISTAARLRPELSNMSGIAEPGEVSSNHEHVNIFVDSTALK